MTRMGRELGLQRLRTRLGTFFHGNRAGPTARGAIERFRSKAADQFIDHGLVYQNKLIYWFNHYLEKNYNGPVTNLTPGAIVVGGRPRVNRRRQSAANRDDDGGE